MTGKPDTPARRGQHGTRDTGAGAAINTILALENMCAIFIVKSRVT